MKTKKKVIRLTESDIKKIVKRVLTEDKNDNIADVIEDSITDKNCIGSGTHIDVVEKYEDITEKKGYTCLGSREGKYMNEIVLVKYLDCGLGTKRLFVFIATKDFSTLTKIGDLSYYGEGIGEGETTLSDLDMLESDVKASCEEKDDCISYEKFKNWFKGHGYTFKQTSTGISFKKYCGNVKSVINLTTSSGGCVERIDERQYVYGEEDEVMTSGQTVWVREDGEKTLDKILYKIKDAIKYGYDKYSEYIEDCSGIL